MKRDLSVSDFVGLELQAERDRRVSRAEQEEDRPLPFGSQFPWSVVLLGLSPLLTIGAVSLVAALLSR